MNELPDKALLRRGEVVAFLGVSEQVMTKMIEAETLTPVYLFGKRQGKAYFTRVQVLKVGAGETSNAQRPTANAEVGKQNGDTLKGGHLTNGDGGHRPPLQQGKQGKL